MAFGYFLFDLISRETEPSSNYRLEVTEAVIINTLGVVLIASMILMIWIVRTSPLKRGSAVLSDNERL